jgi:adenylate kinase
MKIQMIGIQGSGKSTIGKEIAAYLGFSFYTMSDLIKKAVADEDEFVTSKYSTQCINAGRLAPDSVINYLLESIEEPDYVMDGYIRTPQQCNDFCKDATSDDYIIELQISEELAISRMTARNRDDDTPEAIARRISIFNKNIQSIKYNIYNVHHVQVESTSSVKQNVLNVVRHIK